LRGARNVCCEETAEAAGVYIPAGEFTKGKLVVTEEGKKHAAALR
jgi:hypothetical protein